MRWSSPDRRCAEPLSGYNADIGESSISGISSGAFMAVQFGTAWSSVIKGVGVIAGGQYWCAQADAADVMNGLHAPVPARHRLMQVRASAGLENLFRKGRRQGRVRRDRSVAVRQRAKNLCVPRHTTTPWSPRSVTDAAAGFYRHYLGEINRGNLYYQTAIGAGHSLVVAREPHLPGLNACNDNRIPYIDQCGYDQAGILLQHIYGALNAPNRGQLTGTMKRFDQSVYSKPHGTGSLSLGDTGYVFVPKDCADGAACRVHIALHGCKQDVGEIDRRFVDDTGYNAWADTNRLIVLYPQTMPSSLLPFNPQACWDWWSYVDHRDSYVTKAGPQIRTIKAMLDALTARAVPAPAPAAAPGRGADADGDRHLGYRCGSRMDPAGRTARLSHLACRRRWSVLRGRDRRGLQFCRHRPDAAFGISLACLGRL